jgi:hypothetical protein
MNGDATRGQSAWLRRAVWFCAGLLLVFGLGRAVQHAWICDDAFISLRYAENLTLGHGLVYNVGERVEGYTNFLWTLLLAGSMALGLPDLGSAKALGIVAYAALALGLGIASWRRSVRRGTPFLPLAAAVVLASGDFHDWATGGLETSLFAALAFGSMLLATRPAPTTRSDLAAGLLFSALVLTRLDGALLAGAAGIGALTQRDQPLRRTLHIGMPIAVTLLLFGAWKLAYYGELLPTAFYSKSVLDPYPSQGFLYVGLYLQKNWVLPLALVGIPVWRKLVPSPIDAEDRRALVLAGAAALYLAYVVSAGGDFMFARRVVPVVPLLWLALETWLPRSVPPLRLGTATAALVLGAAFAYPVFADRPRISGIADERRFYPPAVLEKRKLQAEAVASALAGTDTRVLFEGGMCVFGYYSRLPYLVELTGLTQYSLAKLPLESRGRVGHEKRATEAWTAENGIHFVLSHAFPPVARPADPPVDHLYFGNVAVARILRYDETIMAHLAQVEGVQFTPIEKAIEHTRREIDRVSLERAEVLYAWLDHYYLRDAGEAGAAIAHDLRATIDAKPR